MLRAFTRGSQEKNNSPILNFPMSIIIPRVTNILKTMSIKPPSSRRAGQVTPEAGQGHNTRLRGRMHLCVARGARGGGGGRHLLLLKISCPWAESVTTHNTFNARAGGPGVRQ